MALTRRVREREYEDSAAPVAPVAPAPTYDEGKRSDGYSEDSDEDEKRRKARCGGPEDAVRNVLRIPPGRPVTYKSPEQELALYAVVQGLSPFVVVLPTGDGKTLLPGAAAVLDDAHYYQQEAKGPSVTILVAFFRALIEDMLVRLRDAGVKVARIAGWP